MSQHDVFRMKYVIFLLHIIDNQCATMIKSIFLYDVIHLIYIIFYAMDIMFSIGITYFVLSFIY